jgi:hypothetical protein
MLIDGKMPPLNSSDELESPRCGPKRNLQRGKVNNEGRIFDMRPKNEQTSSRPIYNEQCREKEPEAY